MTSEVYYQTIIGLGVIVSYLVLILEIMKSVVSLVELCIQPFILSSTVLSLTCMMHPRIQSSILIGCMKVCCFIFSSSGLFGRLCAVVLCSL